MMSTTYLQLGLARITAQCLHAISHNYSEPPMCDDIGVDEDVLQLSTDEQDKLKELFERINFGLHSNPEAFVPAVKQMLVNVEQYASGETGLVSAISTFGKYAGVPAAHHRGFDAKFGVQPTSIGCTKFCPAKRRRLGSGRRRCDAKV